MHTETIETCPRVSSYIQRSICIKPPTAKSQLLMPVQQKCPPLIQKKEGGGVSLCVSQVKECDNDKVAFISAKALSAMQRCTCGHN